MKFKLGELEDALNGIDKLNECVLPAKLSYAITYNGNHIMQEVNIFRSERDKLLEQYAKRDDDGNPIIEELGDGRQKYILNNGRQFDAEYKTLCDMDVDIGIRTVPFSLIEEAAEDEKYTVLTVEQYNALAFMITDDEVEEMEPEKNA